MKENVLSCMEIQNSKMTPMAKYRCTAHNLKDCSSLEWIFLIYA